MAIEEIVVSKVSVVERFEKLFILTINMVCLDSSVEVINKDFIFEYKLPTSISIAEVEITKTLQDYIDKYKREQTIYNHAQLDNLIVDVQNGLEA